MPLEKICMLYHILCIPQLVYINIYLHRFGEFGLGHTKSINKYTELHHLNNMIISLDNIYPLCHGMFIKSIHDELYAVGDNAESRLGIKEDFSNPDISKLHKNTRFKS